MLGKKRLRGMISLLLIQAMLIIVICPGVKADAAVYNPFTDVSTDQVFYDAVMWAYSSKPQVVSGISATKFKPYNTCTRAQIVSFMWRMNGMPEPKLKDNPFVDVDTSAFYYKPVMWAMEMGITAGINKNHFGPNTNCTRAQFVTFLWRLYDTPMPEDSMNPFEDVSDDAFYKNAVLWAKENSITSGKNATHFAPNDEVIRGQTVMFLHRSYQMDQKAPSVLPSYDNKYEFWRSFQSDYIYNSLPENQRIIWDELQKKLIDYMYSDDVSEFTQFDFPNSGMSQTEASTFLQTFYEGNPQFFCINTANMNSGYSSYKSTYSVAPEFLYDFNDYSTRMTAISDFVSRIKSWTDIVSKEKGPWNKEKKAHDIICENTEYGFSNLDQSPYSLVCQGKTVCAGYAKTMMMLMNANGIDTFFMHSNSHAWCVVNIYGEWYCTCCTSDDTGKWSNREFAMYSNVIGDKNDFGYSFFNKSLATIDQDSKGNGNDPEMFIPAEGSFTVDTDFDSTFEMFTPYFVVGNYKYFIVNDNPNRGSCLVKAVVARNGSSLSDKPAAVDFNGIRYVVMD